MWFSPVARFLVAVSGEGRAVVGVTSCFSDIGLENDGHSFLIKSSATSGGSLADLPPQAWRWSALVVFTLWSEDSQGDSLAIVLGQRGGGKNRLKNCQLTFFFFPSSPREVWKRLLVLGKLFPVRVEVLRHPCPRGHLSPNFPSL